LLGQSFKIKTDHQSLKFLLEQKVGTPTQQKWITKLLGYDFTIEYKAGRENVVADALSRKIEDEGVSPQDGQLMLLTIPNPLWVEDIKASYAHDPAIIQIIQDLKADNASHPSFTFRNDLLLYKGRIYVGPVESLRNRIFHLVHDRPAAGHSGYQKSLHRAKLDFYWPGMRSDLKHYLKLCDTCQRNKAETVLPAGLLQPLPIPTRVWADVSMDFIEGLPLSNGFNVIMVVVDRLSKYAHFMALSHPFTAIKVAHIFMTNVFKLHGLPCSIVSDRDPIFTSSFWQELFRLEGTQLAMSTAYHPQTDGQTEIVNKCVEHYLRCYAGKKPKTWSSWLAMAEYWYNTNFHASTKLTPFQVLYGVLPPKLIEYIPGTTRNQAVEDHLHSREQILAILRHNLFPAQERQKAQYDKRHSERSFVPGDWVYLRLQPYKQKTLALRKCLKLSPRFYGPFQVVSKVGEVAYKLALPADSNIHSVFHVSCLKKQLGNHSIPLPSLPPVDAQGEIQPEPAAVLQCRFWKVNNQSLSEVLIHWKGTTVEDATWEPYWDLCSRFPHLVDKVL
jgi:hypothetical protein